MTARIVAPPSRLAIYRAATSSAASCRIQQEPPLFSIDGYEQFIDWRICVELMRPTQYFLCIISTLFFPTLNQFPDRHPLLVLIIDTINGIVGAHLQASLSWISISGTSASCRTRPDPPTHSPVATPWKVRGWGQGGSSRLYLPSNSLPGLFFTSTPEAWSANKRTAG